MFKIDLHTHSSASPDGGITAQQYQNILDKSILDAVAVTDHNSIDLALQLHKELGDRIIVGEEIMTSQGEIIGLYLTETIPGGLSPIDTIRQIKDQGGLVYIPHPFETIRKGISAQTLDEISEYIDVIEVCNGRALVQNRGSQAVVWAKLNNVVGAASSDAHGMKGVGKTYSSLSEMPTKENLIVLLERAVLRTGTPSPRALLYPKYHRLRKKLRKS
jgi:predicted metal-dependent phosphoesterase TrpH